MDIATSLAALKTAIDAAKLVRDAGKSLNEAEWKSRIADLIDTLIDARADIGELQELLRQRDAEIADLKRQAQLEVEMTWQHPFYWRDTDGKRDGPFCQRCFDDQRKPIRLIDQGNGCLKCHVCNGVYEGPDYARHRASEDALARSIGHDPLA